MPPPRATLERLRGACAQEVAIRTGRGEVESRLQRLCGHLRRIAEDPGGAIVLRAGRQDRAEGLLEARIGEASRRQAQPVAEIHGADEQAVDAIGGRDRLDVAQSFLGLDHHHAGHLFVRGLQVGEALMHCRANRAAGPRARRWIAAGGNSLARILDGVHEWHDHALRPDVECLADLVGLVRCDPHQRRDACLRDGGQQVRQVRIVHQAVLQVEAHPVEAEYQRGSRRCTGRTWSARRRWISRAPASVPGHGSASAPPSVGWCVHQASVNRARRR